MKKSYKSGIVTLVVLLGVYAATSWSLEGYLKYGIEESAGNLLQTRVSISDLNISLFNGEGEMEGLVIMNPPDFSEQAAIRFDRLVMKVQLKSLLSDTIVVERLIVKDPNVFVEQHNRSVNIKQLNDNLSSASGKEETSKAMVIDYFRLEEGTVSLKSTLEPEINEAFTISAIELQDVGRDGSNTVNEVIRKLLSPVLKEITQKALQTGIINQVENAVNDLLSQ